MLPLDVATQRDWPAAFMCETAELDDRSRSMLAEMADAVEARRAVEEAGE